MEFLETLREAYGTPLLVVVAAFAIGIVFGIIAEISAYCTRAAVAEWSVPPDDERSAQGGDKRFTLQVLAAIALALAGTQALHMSGAIDLSQSIYWSVAIRPVALIAGGLLFGIGMVLAGGCASRLLVLAASGNGRSWVTLLIMAVAAYATLRGILSSPRIWLEGAWDTNVAPAAFLAEGNALLILSATIFGAAVLAIALILRRSSAVSAWPLVAGTAVGLLVVSAWVATGIVGADDFDPTPLAGLSFVAPVGETVQYLMIFTGDTLRFSIALVGGVLAGAFASSVIGGRFRLQGFTTERSLARYAAGGLLMGFGGVTALGCTVGQGLSGVSTASPASLLAIASIIAGTYGAQRLMAGDTRRPRARHGVAQGAI